MSDRLPLYKVTMNPDDNTGIQFISLVEQPAIEINWKAFTAHLAFAESYNDYPQAASDNAQTALNWAEKNGWGDCGTAVGKARANQLANREPISRDTIARMAAFERHRENSKRELGDGCGRLMWLAWGGDEGIEWAQRKLEQIDREKMHSHKTDIEMFSRVDAQKLAGPFMIPDLPIYRNDEMGEYNLVFTKEVILMMSEKFNKEQRTQSINLHHLPDSKIQGAYITENWIVAADNDKSKNFGFDLPEGTWFGIVKIEDKDFWQSFVKDGKVLGFSIEGLLGMEYIKNNKQMEKTQKFAEYTAEDGTVLSIEKMEVGSPVMVGDQPAPDATYKLTDAEGMIWNLITKDGLVESLTQYVEESKQEEKKFAIDASDPIIVDMLDRLTKLENLVAELLTSGEEMSKKNEELSIANQELSKKIELMSSQPATKSVNKRPAPEKKLSFDEQVTKIRSFKK